MLPCFFCSAFLEFWDCFGYQFFSVYGLLDFVCSVRTLLFMFEDFVIPASSFPVLFWFVDFACIKGHFLSHFWVLHFRVLLLLKYLSRSQFYMILIQLRIFHCAITICLGSKIHFQRTKARTVQGNLTWCIIENIKRIDHRKIKIHSLSTDHYAD